MNPVKFDESNRIFTAPEGMPDCQDLHTFQNEQMIISCWEMTADEKVSALFYGRVWLCVHGNGHPVVSLYAAQSMFQYDEDLERDFSAERKEAIDNFIKRKAKQFWDKHIEHDLDIIMPSNMLSDFLKFALGINSIDQEQEKV